MKRPLTHIPSLIVVFLGISWAMAPAAEAEASNEFSKVVQYELGEAEFAPGDNITIRAVRGTKDSIQPGGTYAVEGTYILNSKEEANLALFATTRNRSPSPIDAKQSVRIKKGTGAFRLIKTMTGDGYLHVSFYSLPAGRGFGGVYFGQGQWVLRRKGFSYLDTPGQGQRGEGGLSANQFLLSGPNRVMMEYLGDPVEPPVPLDPRYSKEGLSAAIQSAARAAGITLQSVDFDDSEYPFLIGVVCQQGDFPKLREQVRRLNGYEDHGSVGSQVCHTMNIVPWRAYPAEASQRIERRITLRQQIFLEKLGQERSNSSHSGAFTPHGDAPHSN